MKRLFGKRFGWKNGYPYWNNYKFFFFGIPILKVDTYKMVMKLLKMKGKIDLK